MQHLYLLMGDSLTFTFAACQPNPPANGPFNSAKSSPTWPQ